MKLINAVCCGVALFSLSAWAQSTPAVPEVMKELRKIESAQYRGEVDLLRIGYQDAAKAQPTDVMSRVYVAWCSMVSDDAWNQLKNIATMNPENPWVHYGMGRVYVSWKMRDPARGEFELVLKKDPGFAPALTGLGDLARQAKDWSTAERKYHEALALQDDPLAHSGLGLTLLALGKTAEAQKELARAIALWPDQPATLSALVPLLVAAKDPGALDAAARVAELRPRDRDVRRQLADLRFETGDLKGAVADYEKLLTLGTPDVAVVKRVLDQYRTSGDAPNEARLQAMLATLDRDDPAPVLRLAELKLAANDAEGAQAQLLAALERDPKRATTYNLLAKLRLKANAPYEALERYRQASKLEGDGVEEAKAEVARLENDFKLPKKVPHGSVDAIYSQVATSLDGFFADKKRMNPKLGGDIKLRVRVAPDGVVQGVDVLTDTVGDSALLGHAYVALLDAEFEKRKREPVFEFELGQKKKK